MVAQEGPPSLGWRSAAADHVLGHRRLGDFEPKLQQFAMDAWGAPQRVLLAHPSDEFAQFLLDQRSSGPTSRLPSPVGPEPRPVPTQDGVWLNDLGQTEQVRPQPSHPYQQRSVTPTQPQTVRRTPQGNIELMAEKEVLGFKPAPRLEQIGIDRSKHLEDREHRAR